MMNDVSITVVMAVYNAEKYLRRSIGSVIKQSVDKWKLICVDDGSTDSSWEILTEFEKLDPRISIYKQDNNGPAAARARGYVATDTTHAMILDADDEYCTDCLEKIYSLLDKDVDCIMPNVLIEHRDGSISNWFDDYGLVHGQFFSSEEAFERSLLSPSVHGWCLYRTALLKQYAVGDNAHYNSFNEDEFIQRVLLLKSRQIFLSEGKYVYHYNSSSITKGFQLKHLGYLMTCNKIVELASGQGLAERLQDLTYEYLFRTLVQLRYRQIHSCTTISKDDRMIISTQFREYFLFCKKNKGRIHYSDKKRPGLYRFAMLSNYSLMSIICWIKQ